MLSEQRDMLEESISKIRSGRLTRRSFLERAPMLGLTGSAALALLEACGGSANSSGGNGAATSIVWQSEQESTLTYKKLTETFNRTVGQQKGIYVTWNQGPSSTNDILIKYTNMLRARSSSIDVLSIDIVYPAQFAAAAWIRPITERQWPVTERQRYLPGPIKGCTYKGQIWAAPFRTDVGLIYYRKDLLTTPPTTWDDLTSIAAAQQTKARYGYVWQGAQYEGLVCNFAEVLYGYGGSVLDPNDPTKVTVDSPEARQALTKMVSWINTISPPAVTTYMEDSARLVWQNGDAVFMRNWPYAYALSNDPGQSRLAGKFAIHAMPYGGDNRAGHSAIGGWNMAINAFTPRTEQSWEFIRYMLQQDAQEKTAIDAALTVTLASIYDDPTVLAKQPLFGKLKPIVQASLPRPVSPLYTDVSDAIQRNIYQALKKQQSPAQALKALAADLKRITTQQT